MTSTVEIPAVIIGVHRSTAIASGTAFNGTAYRLVAALDLFESPKQYQYNAGNLGAVLYALHPRPRILISGTAVGRIVPEVKAVWKEYAEKALRAESEDERAVFVPVSLRHLSCDCSCRFVKVWMLTDSIFS